ncbi:MAG: hypothetical protein J0I19_15460 [Alphaproteobacteria bacterium]|nr:hypothetical protein [Alphaproteobacteria bacterium]
MRNSHAIKNVECEDAAAVDAGPGAEAGVHHFPGAKVQAVMDPRIYKIALGCWIGFLAVFWLTFWMSANALFMVVISTVYAVMFFGVPYAMSRQVRDRPKTDKSLFAFLSQPFATIDGVMSGAEALLQVVLVPLCLTAGGIAIGIIIHAARAAVH